MQSVIIKNNSSLLIKPRYKDFTHRLVYVI